MDAGCRSLAAPTASGSAAAPAAQADAPRRARATGTPAPPARTAPPPCGAGVRRGRGPPAFRATRRASLGRGAARPPPDSPSGSDWPCTIPTRKSVRLRLVRLALARPDADEMLERSGAGAVDGGAGGGEGGPLDRGGGQHSRPARPLGLRLRRLLVVD